MSMKARFGSVTAATVAIALVGAPGVASAVTVTTQEPNFSEMLYNNNGPNSASMEMFSKPGFYLMTVSSTEALSQAGAGTGHAWLSAADGALTDITFAASSTVWPPYNLFESFDSFGVKTTFTDSVGTGKDKVNFSSYTYDVQFTFTNAGPLTITLPGSYLPDLPNSGQMNFFADANEGAFTSIKFFNVTGYDSAGAAYATTFANFKQPSFEVTGVVPEPGTWALMIIGFGGAGAMLRRRRHALA